MKPIHLLFIISYLFLVNIVGVLKLKTQTLKIILSSRMHEGSKIKFLSMTVYSGLLTIGQYCTIHNIYSPLKDYSLGRIQDFTEGR